MWRQTINNKWKQIPAQLAPPSQPHSSTNFLYYHDKLKIPTELLSKTSPPNVWVSIIENTGDLRGG
jgi:hypothetical protein